MESLIHICAKVTVVLLIGGVYCAENLPGDNMDINSQGDIEELNMQKCRVQEAVTMEDTKKIEKHSAHNKEMLFKVTDMPDYYKYFGENENFCSVYHHGPHCGALQFFIVQRGTQVGKAAIISYNFKTKTILRTYKTVRRQNEHIAIVSGELTNMEHVNAKNEIELMEQIPEIVQKKHNSLTSVIGVAPHRKWFILKSEDGATIWVKIVIPRDERPTNPKLLAKWNRIMKEYVANINPELAKSESIWEDTLKYLEQEIDQELLKHVEDLSKMKKVPLTFPFLPSPLF